MRKRKKTKYVHEGRYVAEGDKLGFFSTSPANYDASADGTEPLYAGAIARVGEVIGQTCRGAPLFDVSELWTEVELRSG